ncbi:MAG: hypothetical protein QM791_01360 [Ferruginibacter sp.]
MLEIYKTNVKTKAESRKVVRSLQAIFPSAVINFDLQDCDKILRVNGIKASETTGVICHLLQLGHHCEILPF